MTPRRNEGTKIPHASSSGNTARDTHYVILTYASSSSSSWHVIMRAAEKELESWLS